MYTVAPTNQGGFLLRWSSVQGRTYTLFRGTNLLSGGFSEMATGISGTPPENVYTDNLQSVEMRFYRVRTSP